MIIYLDKMYMYKPTGDKISFVGVFFMFFGAQPVKRCDDSYKYLH